MFKSKHLAVAAPFEARKAAFLEWATMEAAALSAELALVPANSPDREFLKKQLWTLECKLALDFLYPYTYHISGGE